MDAVLVGFALLAGGLLSVQASANLQLTTAIGTPYGASTLQLAIAAGLLGTLAIATGAVGAVTLLPDAEWWHLLGGLASPLYIMSGILLFPRLGALAATGLFVTGQVFASLALDLFGLLGLEKSPLGVGVVAGAVAVLVGIALILGLQRVLRGSTDSAAPRGRRSRLAFIGLGLVAGAALPVQGAVNARLRADVGEVVLVGTVSFVVATLAIAVVLAALVMAGQTPCPRLEPLGGMPWWGWLGGACAATYVTATFLLIPQIGAATAVALTVTGQQLASAFIDTRGLLRVPQRALTAARISGLALLVSGSALVQLA